MAKLTAWLVTIIGILLVLPLIWNLDTNMLMINSTLIAILVLVMGVTKLMRNYKKRGKK